MNNNSTKRFILGSIALAAVVPSALLYYSFRRDLSRARHRIARGGKVIETACGLIQFAEFGEGSPMLIVHGAGGGYDQGEYFARLIGGNYHWIAPSRFGFLRQPVPEEANSEMQADAFACLLDALGIDRIGVIGVSMGGPSSLLFARRYPERTRSLAMISAASHAIPPRPSLLAAVFKIFLNDFVFWSMCRLSPNGLLAALGVPLDVQQELSRGDNERARAFLSSILPMSARKTGQLIEQHMSEYEASQIEGIQAPTLVVHARDDTLVAFEHAEFAAQNIPGAQLISLEKGGHLAFMFDFNQDARRRVLEFLDRYKS